eukprot:gene15957-18919_t
MVGSDPYRGYSTQEQATTAWIQEEYELWKCQGNWEDVDGVGHLTAAVWKGIDLIGCAQTGTYYVCEYGSIYCKEKGQQYECAATCYDNTCDYWGSSGGYTGQCESCLTAAQCPDGYFCCPYMKKCVASSSMSCSYPIANCNDPRCYDSSCNDEGCDCEGCAEVGEGKTYGWLEWVNLGRSNEGTSRAELTCSESTSAPPPSECPDGYFCCPYMKKCVASSSMSCSYPIANCNDPRCYDSSCNDEGCDCEGCAEVGEGKTYGWLEWVNLGRSNEGTSRAELTCSESTS